ncbi:DNA alkylation repair protein [Lentzea nigeriaca]|uniref:DNA alkylation repair protein n=1 Tax=Lentzea nigeriaca TaxID=1128665 RepID=UPI00195EAD21|nr:DNA alkylation repair protein [Lentzea nigeriaca]MBM7858594.1 3-methyladenine DNA glycosylase AlkC [Lentzea nigeriaca]
MSTSALRKEFKDITEDVSVPQLRRNTAAFWKRHHGDPAGVTTALTGLWTGAADESLRMGIAMTLGPAADTVADAMEFLLVTVPRDDDWRVQEALAKGFDWFCAVRGWEKSVPVIEQWLGHEHHNVRRAAAEGPRVWTKRPYFKDNPEHALELLGRLRADSSEYVRKSVGNSLSDISKTHPDLTLASLSAWAAEPGAAWVITRACRHLVDTRAEQTKRLLAVMKG